MGYPIFEKQDFDKRKMIIRKIERSETLQCEETVRKFIKDNLLENQTWWIVLTTITQQLSLAYIVLTGGVLYHVSGSTLCVTCSPLLYVIVIYVRLRIHVRNDKSIKNNAWQANVTQDDVINRLYAHFSRKGNGLWVVEYENVLLGTVAIDRRGQETAVLKYLCVDGDVRRRGLGEKLLHTAVKFSKECRYRKTICTATKIEYPKQQLFIKYGFNKTKEEVRLTLLPFISLITVHFTLSQR